MDAAPDTGCNNSLLARRVVVDCLGCRRPGGGLLHDALVHRSCRAPEGPSGLVRRGCRRSGLQHWLVGHPHNGGKLALQPSCLPGFGATWSLPRPDRSGLSLRSVARTARPCVGHPRTSQSSAPYRYYPFDRARTEYRSAGTVPSVSRMGASLR